MFKHFSVATLLSANVVLGRGNYDGTSYENSAESTTFEDDRNKQHINVWYSEE